MQSADSVCLLLELANAAREGRPAPPAAADWLTAGVAGFLDGEPLALALGLAAAGPGHASARHEFLARVRDHHLYEAHRLTGGPSPWSRSLALAREIRRFEATVWPRWRHCDAPPEGASGLRRALFAAFKTGLEIPGSPRQLARIAARRHAAPPPVVTATLTI